MARQGCWISKSPTNERFFNKIKQCRRVATRYDKLAANYLASSSSRQYGYGCALKSPRPSSPQPWSLQLSNKALAKASWSSLAPWSVNSPSPRRPPSGAVGCGRTRCVPTVMQSSRLTSFGRADRGFRALDPPIPCRSIREGLFSVPLPSPARLKSNFLRRL
jgi:hypothetical protein